VNQLPVLKAFNIKEKELEETLMRWEKLEKNKLIFS